MRWRNRRNSILACHIGFRFCIAASGIVATSGVIAIVLGLALQNTLGDVFSGGAGKAFALLREALMKTGKVGIAQFVLRNRDSLCMLKPYGQGLVLNALRFAGEIRSMEELSLPSTEKISPSEVSLAIKLIEGMADSFDPAKYKDTYTDEVQKLIEAKAKGQKRVAPAPKAAKSNVITW